MTVSSLETGLAGPPQVQRASNIVIPRDEFFAVLFLLGCASALGGPILSAIRGGDWTGGIEDVSAIVWFSCFAGLSLLFLQRNRNDPIRTPDIGAAAIYLL